MQGPLLQTTFVKRIAVASYLSAHSRATSRSCKRHTNVGVRVSTCLGLAAPCPTNASGLEAKAACACGRMHIMFRRRLTRVQHLLGKGAENGPGASGRACAVLRAWQAPQPHARGSTQTAPVAARSVHCPQHNACSVSIMCGCCYNVGRRNGMTFATVPAGACAWASAFRWTATANPNANTVPRRPPQDLVPFPHRVSAC